MNSEPPKKNPRHLNGFTLIELLLAIAVVSVLSLLLSTTIQETRKQGQVAKNLSNLRNLQLANINYATDNNGAYVAVCSFDENGALNNTWTSNAEFLCDYLGLPQSRQWPDEMRSPMAVMLRQQSGLSLSNSYGYNFTGLTAYGTPGGNRQATITSVSHPPATLAFADSLDWQIQMSGANRYQGNEEKQNNAIAYRYGGKAGVVYFDGHTEMLDKEQVVDNRMLWQIRKN